MATQFPKANAPTEQQKWVRAVERAVNQAERDAANAANRIGNGASSQAGLLGRIQTEVTTLQEVTEGLRNSVDYQASLITVSADGVTYDAPVSPGDQTFRYYESSPSLKVSLRVPTGRILLQFGSGECRVNPGQGTISASTTFHIDGDRGFSYDPPTSRARVTAYPGPLIAVPLAASTAVNVPSDQLITVTMKYGVWSNTDTSAGDAHHTSNYLVAQVIPA